MQSSAFATFSVPAQVLDDHDMGLLPADFVIKDHGRWLQLASCKALVEPVDVANYEQLGFEKKSGAYLAHNNRPSRYVRIEKLVETADKGRQPRGDRMSRLTWCAGVAGACLLRCFGHRFA